MSAKCEEHHQDGREDEDEGANGDEHAVAGVHSEDDQAGDDHGGHAEQDQHGDRGRHAVGRAGARVRRLGGAEATHHDHDEGQEQEDAVEDEADHLGHALMLLFHTMTMMR